MGKANVIDNPVFGKDKVSLQSVVLKSTENQELIGPDIDSVNNFAQEFAKDASFYKLKMLNTTLLLLTAILTSVASLTQMRIDYWLSWHNDKLILRPPYKELFQGDCLNVINWIMFSMTTFSLVIYRCQRTAVEKSKMILSSLAITDICFSAFFMLHLVINFANFALRSFSEWYWFMIGSRLAYGNWLAETVDSNSQERTTTSPASTTLAPFQEWSMPIIARLLLEPSITILAILAIMVNIVFVWRIGKAIKRSNLWASNSEELYPNCSQLYASYSSFWQYGVLKIVNWIIPVLLILVIIYTPAGIYDYYNIIIALAVCFVLCFSRLIFYIQKARFRTADFCSSNDEKILSSLTTDLVIWSAAAVFYFVLYNDILWWSAELIQKCSLGGMLFTVASILANLRLIYAYGGMRKFNLKLAQISINVSVNVIKDTEPTTELKREKSVSDDREKKEEHDEKTI